MSENIVSDYQYRYVDFYYENMLYFEQFINLKQTILTGDEYTYQFQ